MPAPKIAINGFGRIGRTITRIAKLRGHYDVVAVNDLASADDLAYAFKYDSIHGVYAGDIQCSGSGRAHGFLIVKEQSYITVHIKLEQFTVYRAM